MDDENMYLLYELCRNRIDEILDLFIRETPWYLTVELANATDLEMRNGNICGVNELLLRYMNIHQTSDQQHVPLVSQNTINGCVDNLATLRNIASGEYERHRLLHVLNVFESSLRESMANVTQAEQNIVFKLIGTYRQQLVNRQKPSQHSIETIGELIKTHRNVAPDSLDFDKTLQLLEQIGARF